MPEGWGGLSGEPEELDDECRCPECGALVNDDGMTVDPERCCFYCKAD